MLSLLEQTALVARELEDNLVNLRVLWKREFALLARTTTRYKNLRNPNTTSMTISTRFRFLEHTADVYIAAYGKNLKEAFENAAAAMFETMTNLNQITPTKKDTVHTTARDEQALLYNWLEALLIKFDTTGMLCSKFKIHSLAQTRGHLALNATVWGEPFNPQKHLQKVGVKAITYHQMQIAKRPNQVEVRFILDI
jgi:SHS2 domain-containing protein